MVDDVDLREMRGIIINTMGTNEENAGKLPWTPRVIYDSSEQRGLLLGRIGYSCQQIFPVILS